MGYVSALKQQNFIAYSSIQWWKITQNYPHDCNMHAEMTDEMPEIYRNTASESQENQSEPIKSTSGAMKRPAVILPFGEEGVTFFTPSAEQSGASEFSDKGGLMLTASPWTPL